MKPRWLFRYFREIGRKIPIVPPHVGVLDHPLSETAPAAATAFLRFKVKKRESRTRTNRSSWVELRTGTIAVKKEMAETRT